MAEKYINPFTGKPQKEVLRITSQREISRTDERLVCGGTVKWNDGTKDDIEFSREVDAEGDNWTNWEIKE